MKQKYRLVKSGKVAFNKDIQVRESQSKKDLYKRIINKCCMPMCRHGYDLHIHHITPINKGGHDAFLNYIVLCSYCHQNSKIHSKSEENKISLFVYKFMEEQNKLGFEITSDIYSDEEFYKLLKNIKFKDKHKTRTLQEENQDNDYNIDFLEKVYENGLECQNNTQENLDVYNLRKMGYRVINNKEDNSYINILDIKRVKKEYDKQYHQIPEVKQRIKKYRQRPEFKKKQEKYNQRIETKQNKNKYSKKYRQRPEVKQKIKEYYKKNSFEIKNKRKEYYREHRLEILKKLNKKRGIRA